MKCSASLLAGAALAASLHAEDIAAEPTSAVDPNAAIEMVAKHYAQLTAALNSFDGGGGAPAQRSRRNRSEQRAGLQTASLATSALQPSSGLSGAGLGLTSPEEWLRRFPRKER